MNPSTISILKLGMLSSAIMTSILLTACSSSSSSNNSGQSTPNKSNQTINFPAPEVLGVGESAQLKATASSKLDITYATSTPEVCDITKNKVMAKATGDCKLTANQAGNTSFKPAEEVMVNVTVVPATVAVDANNVQLNQKSTITLSGKQVTPQIKATLAGKEVTVTSTGDYQAVISFAPDMAGQLPLLITSGKQTLYDDIITVALPKATGNDYTVKKTGATKCGNLTQNDIKCDDKDKLGEFYNTNQDGEVQAGAAMAYTKVAHQTKDADGNKVMQTCIYDNTTGLLWEQKTDKGLRNKDWRYTWYDSQSATNGGYEGAEAPKEDSCGKTLTKCNSEAYIAKLNGMNYCGHSDWRLPNADELTGLYDFGKTEEPLLNPIFEPIAKVADPHDSKNDPTGYYMTGNTIPTIQLYKDNHYQFFPIQGFSIVDSLQTVGRKNAENAYHIIAVRHD